jgi:probable F420-dependent oxidoreductase
LPAIEYGVMASGQSPEAVPDPGIFRDIASTAEGLGYDSLWCGDHLSYGNPILEGIVALSSFAAYTSSITIGTGVLLLPLRSPGLVAKQMATIDYLTGGRVICGVGVGGDSDKDFELVGVAKAERGARTDEGIRVLKALWGAQTASFEGAFSSFSDVALSPMPVTPGGPPIWVGGWAPGALRRAGSLADGWMGYMVSTGRYASNLADVLAAASNAGRPVSAITPSLMLPTRVDHDGDAAREALRAHLSKRYHRDFARALVDKVCLAGNPDEVRARVDAYREAGVRHLIFLYAGEPSDAADEFEMLSTEVVSLGGHSVMEAKR